MTSSDTETMQALQELLAERQRYEGWIGALETRQASTPAHVFTRVHTDYTLRLERVMQRLSERTEQLCSTIDAKSEHLNTLRAKESERVDTRQEAELRALVGEYTDEEWTYLRDEADREINAVATERKSVEAELEELERIIALTKASPVPAPEAAADGAGNAAPPVATEDATSAGTVSAFASESTSVESSTDDAPSIENFVADWPVRQMNQSGSAQSNGVAEVPEVDHALPTALATAAEPVSTARSTTLPESALDAPNPDSRREQEKTLKCPECGTMNYATEWYCERCGGELATF